MKPAFDRMSYLVGLLDGEGSIGYQSNGREKAKRFTIEVKMTSENVIDWLKLNFGGVKKSRPATIPRHKDQWRWRLQGEKAKSLYREIRPYLMVKNANLN